MTTGLAAGVGVKIWPLSQGSVVIVFLRLDSTNYRISIGTMDGNRAAYKLWLCDDATSGRPTAVLPSEAGIAVWEGITAADGTVEINFKHAGEHAWYVFGILNRITIAAMT